MGVSFPGRVVGNPSHRDSLGDVSLRIGVQLPEVERDVRWPEYVAMAQAAEAGGFDSIWVGDHHLYRGDGRPERGPWEAWTLLAGLAAVTSRVELGPLVACAGFHPPAVLAKMAATVDEISGGRLIVGLGAGWNRAEFDGFGIPFDHRVSRFAEAFEIVRRLLAGDRVTLEGRWWTVRDAVVLPTPSRRPPIMVGSTGERVLALTLPHVDAWNTWFDAYRNTPEGFAELNATVTRAAAAAHRDPASIRRSACALVVLDPDARERATEGVRSISGEPEVIAAALRSLAEAGADEIVLVMDPCTRGSIEVLAAALPFLRDLRVAGPPPGYPVRHGPTDPRRDPA
jgi:probable F420-dependent oxidoreductase